MSKGLKRVAVYLRVSTGEQTTENQKRELKLVAKRHNWNIVEFFEDAGISGTKGRDKRPGLDRLLKAVARKDVDMVAAWSVDRLGRSLIDLLDFLRELHAKASICSYISRGSIRRRRPARPCSRCWASLPSLSGR